MQSDDETMDVATQERPSQRLRNHKLSPTCICVDSDNKHAFTASKDGSIIKWCLETQRIVNKIDPTPKNKNKDKHGEPSDKAHTRYIRAIAISSDDKYLATGGWDKHIRIWNPKSMKMVHIFKKHRQEITALTFRKDHEMLYSASTDKSIMLWSVEEDNFSFVEALYGHESPITSLDALRRERVLSAGGLDQSIRIWKIVEQAQTVFTSCHGSVDVAKYVDDSTFVTGGSDGKISVWTTMKRNPVFSLTNPHRIENSKQIDRHDRKCENSWISSLAIYSMKFIAKSTTKVTKKQKVRDSGCDDRAHASRVEDDGSEDESDSSGDQNDNGEEDLAGDTCDGKTMALVASGSSNGSIILWRLTKISGKYSLDEQQAWECPGFVNDLTFTCDGKKILAACGQEHKLGGWWKLKDAKNKMRIFDVKT